MAWAEMIPGNVFQSGSVHHRYNYVQTYNQLYNSWFDDIGNLLFTISLDYLDIMYRGDIPNGSDDNTIFEISDAIVLEWKGYGTPIFQDSFKVHVYGDHFATLHANPRTTKKGVRTDNVQVHLENDYLYTTLWHDTLKQVEKELCLTYQNVSRLDIAIDGLNYLIGMLNWYIKQSAEEKTIRKVGKAMLNGKAWVDNGMGYKSFHIGSSSSPKYITVYPKLSELKISHKQYIKEFWAINGIVPETDEDEVYRFEMRFRSKALKEIKDFNLDACTNLRYLHNLVKTGCNKFFEFREFNTSDSNIWRTKKINLMPYDFYETHLLEKYGRKLSDGSYKAKILVHHVVKDYLKGTLKRDQIFSSILAMKAAIEHYDLYQWYHDKLHEWIKIYGKLNPDAKDRDILKIATSESN